MAIIAPVEDGKIVDTTNQNSLTSAVSKGGSSMDKEAFLQLLVAQMKYQDPLEPTSNTEYISQFATFSELEQMQNMSASMDLSRASGLVGEMVYVKTTDSAGNPTYVVGKVDYVYYENGKAYLSINEELYPLDNLDTVVDETYYDAYNKAYDLAAAIEKLPKLSALTLSDKDAVEKIYETYNGMNDYEKTFIATEYKDKIQKYYDKLQELIKASESTEGDSESGSEGDSESGSTETE